MDAGDFLDQVLFDRDVETARGRGNRPAILGRHGLHAERTQDAFDLDVGHGDAEHTCDAGAAQPHRGGGAQVLGQRRFRHRAGAAAHDLQGQGRGALDRVARQLRVDAALEAMRGIGMHAQLTGAADDRARSPVRGLEEHPRRCGGDARVPTAHHAAEGDGAIVVGDDEELAIERHFAFVEQFQGFAGARVAHDDRAVQGVGIEGMQRLAEFEHHVVGDVHERADRTQAGTLEALAHPQRRTRVRIQALDDATAEARAIAIGLQFDDEARLRLDLRFRNLDRIDLGTERRRGIERHAAHAEAVGAVRRQLQLETRVGQAEIFRQRLAHRRIGR